VSERLPRDRLSVSDVSVESRPFSGPAEGALIRKVTTRKAETLKFFRLDWMGQFSWPRFLRRSSLFQWFLNAALIGIAITVGVFLYQFLYTVFENKLTEATLLYQTLTRHKTGIYRSLDARSIYHVHNHPIFACQS
jgi:hypothetical protein